MAPSDGILWISESRAQDLCRLSRPAWKSGVRAGLFEEDPGGAYDERAVIEIALVCCLREHLTPANTRAARRGLVRDGRWEELLVKARTLRDEDAFDLVIEPESCAVRLAMDDAALVRAVRHPADPRIVLVVSLADRLRRIRDGFRTIAVARERPRERRVGRPARVDAEILPIRPEQG